MNVNKVRQDLLSEAKASPNLLSDLAGLEKYIAESYHNRSFIELLQNADDALSTDFIITKSNDFLYVANNGRFFNQTDLENLCRSASSAKIRGETIGYRGIGFKSVVGFTEEIHVLSGELEITFSKIRTKTEIPEASRVPLIRIPHYLTEKDRNLILPIVKTLKTEGYTTIFVFTGVVANEIESEFDSFDQNSLIFLRNILKTEINTLQKQKINIHRQKINDSEIEISITGNNFKSNWKLFTNGQIVLACSIDENQITKLPEDESLVYAFLPTEDKSGLGVLINGNFSTDPSRRHVIFDDDSLKSLELCSYYIIKIIEKNIVLSNKNNTDLINVLIPSADPRMIQFKKTSFEKMLFDSLKKVKSNLFSELMLCPSWLNIKDYSILKGEKDNTLIDNRYYELNGFVSFAKFLGAKEDTFEILSNKINEVELSILGCAQISSYVFKKIISKNLKNPQSILILKILISNNERVSLVEFGDSDKILDISYISILSEHGITGSDITQVFKMLIPQKGDSIIFEDQSIEQTGNETIQDSSPEEKWFKKSKEISSHIVNISKQRWRSAEELTLEILNLNGFKLDDVSKQNIGYDLQGLDPTGNNIMIEVKSISLPGQKFNLTNNEMAVAQNNQTSFYIAVVRQLKDSFEIALIHDPINNLTFNRQCMKWIWECTNYEYKPIEFEI
jgi:hypothetical protein